MATISCPACAARIPDQTLTCPNCGKPLPSSGSDSEGSGDATRLPIETFGGKLQVIGTVIMAGAVVATFTGAWWGPALLFPGIILFILGRF